MPPESLRFRINSECIMVMNHLKLTMNCVYVSGLLAQGFRQQLIVSFNIFMLIKCAFVGHKNFECSLYLHMLTQENRNT
jgi:hypothetical protein